MGLLTPSPGEVVDRQTILELKIEAAKEKQLPANSFVDEYDQLKRYLENNSFILAPVKHDYDLLYGKLKEVNTKLWKIEDEIRLIIRQAGDASKLTADQKALVCSISFEIPRLNDQRAALVQQVNALFKISRLEKLYN